MSCTIDNSIVCDKELDEIRYNCNKNHQSKDTAQIEMTLWVVPSLLEQGSPGVWAVTQTALADNQGCQVRALSRSQI